MRKPKNYKVTKRTLDKEVIEIVSDTDEDCGKALALCSQANTGRQRDYRLTVDGENNSASNQIVCAHDCDPAYVYDLEYMKYLATYNEDCARDSSPLRLMFNVGEASDRRKGKPGRKPKFSSVPCVSKRLEPEKRKAGRKPKALSILGAPKKLKIENGRADHKPVLIKEKSKRGRKPKSSSISVAPKKLKIEKDRGYHYSVLVKEKSKRGRKPKRPETESCRAVHYSSWRTEKTHEVQHGTKKGGAKERSNVKCKTILRASKRLKRADHNSIQLVNTIDTNRKIRNNVESNSIPDNFKSCNEKMVLPADESYAYYLRNSITRSTEGREKDLVCSDIIAISDRPFSDGGDFPFEANKDEKVIDLEDDMEECNDLFNSRYSKKLMKTLRKPYDEKEYLKLYNDAKLKIPKTRSRQLRDGREIEYKVQSEFALSYLEQHTDFEKKFRRCGKDLPRALNLLRGLFFYLKNVACEGQFKPWEYETRLEAML